MEFNNPHTHKYTLKPYGKEIETRYLNNFIKSSPYLLVKLSNGKLGYIHTQNFDPVEFDNQDGPKNELLKFLSNKCTY